MAGNANRIHESAVMLALLSFVEDRVVFSLNSWMVQSKEK